MNSFRAGILTAACASVVMLWAAPAGAANNAGVNIIYPPKLASDFDTDEAAPAAPATEIKVKVYLAPESRRAFYRWRIRHKNNCKLYQYWSFSRRACGRRLYPF